MSAFKDIFSIFSTSRKGKKSKTRQRSTRQRSTRQRKHGNKKHTRRVRKMRGGWGGTPIPGVMTGGWGPALQM